jgi:hypothetical protein
MLYNRSKERLYYTEDSREKYRIRHLAHSSGLINASSRVLRIMAEDHRPGRTGEACP